MAGKKCSYKEPSVNPIEWVCVAIPLILTFPVVYDLDFDKNLTTVANLNIFQ